MSSGSAQPAPLALAAGEPAAAAAAAAEAPIRVLFVCLGNICRSPMAEAVFAATAAGAGAGAGLPRRVEADSAGTGAYHAGADPDERTLRTLARHGIDDFEHAARRVRPADFAAFDYVLAMDRENLEDLRDVRARATRELLPLKGSPAAASVAAEDDDGDADAVPVPMRGKARRQQQQQQQGRGEAGDGLAKLAMFGDYGGRKSGEEIDDPYYGGGRGFEIAYEQCVRFTNGLLTEILGEGWEQKAKAAGKGSSGGAVHDFDGE